MTAVKYDFVCEQGADWRKEIGLKLEEDSEGFVDLTGATFEMQIRSGIGGALLHDLTPDITLNDENNIVILAISAEDTLAIDLTGLPTKTIKIGTDSNGNPVSVSGPAGVYDLFKIDASGDRKKQLYGLFVIPQAITEAD